MADGISRIPNRDHAVCHSHPPSAISDKPSAIC